MNVQNHFLQITIQKGRIVENDLKETEKIVDSIEIDDLYCTPGELDVTELLRIIQTETQKIS